MDEFKRRERAFEAHFALEEEINFLINAKTSHIFGHWLAHEKLHLNDAPAAELENLLVRENLMHGKLELILDVAMHSLQAHDLPASDVELKHQFMLAQKKARLEFSQTLH